MPISTVRAPYQYTWDYIFSMIRGFCIHMIVSSSKSTHIVTHKNNMRSHILCIEMCMCPVNAKNYACMWLMYETPGLSTPAAEPFLKQFQIHSEAQWENHSALPCSIANKKLITELAVAGFIWFLHSEWRWRHLHHHAFKPDFMVKKSLIVGFNDLTPSNNKKRIKEWRTVELYIRRIHRNFSVMGETKVSLENARWWMIFTKSMWDVFNHLCAYFESWILLTEPEKQRLYFVFKDLQNISIRKCPRCIIRAKKQLVLEIHSRPKQSIINVATKSALVFCFLYFNPIWNIQHVNNLLFTFVLLT